MIASTYNVDACGYMYIYIYIYIYICACMFCICMDICTCKFMYIYRSGFQQHTSRTVTGILVSNDEAVESPSPIFWHHRLRRTYFGIPKLCAIPKRER